MVTASDRSRRALWPGRLLRALFILRLLTLFTLLLVPGTYCGGLFLFLMLYLGGLCDFSFLLHYLYQLVGK